MSNGSEPPAASASPAGPFSAPVAWPLGLATFAASLAPPGRDPLVMSGEQHLGRAPAPIVRRARVVRILGMPLEGHAEGLLGRRALVAESAGELARDGIADHHRRQLAAAEHVASDRDHVARKMLEDALVEPLVAAAEERQRGLCRQLLDKLLV